MLLRRAHLLLLAPRRQLLRRALATTTTTTTTMTQSIPPPPTPTPSTTTTTTTPAVQGDLNNTLSMRPATQSFPVDPAYLTTTLAPPPSLDDPHIRTTYRPFLLPDSIASTDWVSRLELTTTLKLVEANLARGEEGGGRLRVLVLYGSLRARSYSRLLAFEAARILWRLGCDVRVYDPAGLPVKDDVQHEHAKVQELREMSKWSDGQFWVSPEQHGQLTGVFKNLLDWIPLSTGSIRPTQGRTLAIAQVCGGSQSFNAVNTLRLLGRWMRMFVIANQSSVPQAWTQFTDALGDDGVDEVEAIEKEGGSRMKPSGNRERLVDCCEEFVKYSLVFRPHFELMGDRYSEREERRRKEEAKGV